MQDHQSGRRHALECMALGRHRPALDRQRRHPRAALLGEAQAATGFTFVQISDTHIGFNTRQPRSRPRPCGEAVARIRAADQPAFLLHTGDVTHLSKPERVRRAEQMIKARQQRVPLRPRRARRG